MDVFSIINDGLKSLLENSFLIVPGLEKATAIISFIIVVLFFLFVFTLPLQLIRIIFNLDELEKSTFKKKKRYFRK